MSTSAARWLPLLALLAFAGCLQTIAPEGGHHAPDPLATVPGPECREGDEEERLAAWRQGIRRQGVRPCASVPDDVQLDFRVNGINVGDHGAAKASPVPIGGDWLVPGDTGKVHRIDAHGGTEWSAATSPSYAGIHGTPAVANGTVYVGAYDGSLYAFDADTGEQRWRTPLGNWIGSSPLVHEGRVYVAVETHHPSGLVSVVDASTGEEVFRDERITNHPHSSIGLSPEEDTYVVGANDGRLYAWNATTNEHRWTFETGGPIKGPVAIHDGAAFFGSWDDRVYRVDLETGIEDWSYETGANVMAGPAIDPATGTVFVGSYDEHVYGLDATDGHLRWRAPLGGPAMSSPVLADGLVLVGSHDGHLYALDGRDGSQVWRFEAGDRVTGTPAVQDGHVAVTTAYGDSPGRLYVLEGRGGRT